MGSVNRRLGVFVFLIGLFVVSLFVGGETESNYVIDANSELDGVRVYYFFGQGCSYCAKVKPFIVEMVQAFSMARDEDPFALDLLSD